MFHIQPLIFKPRKQNREFTWRRLMGGLLIMNILLAVARTPHMEVESDLNYKRHFSKSFEISQRFSNQSDQNSARLSDWGLFWSLQLEEVPQRHRLSYSDPSAPVCVRCSHRFPPRLGNHSRRRQLLDSKTHRAQSPGLRCSSDALMEICCWLISNMNSVGKVEMSAPSGQRR